MLNTSDGSVLGPVLKDRPDRPNFGRTGPPEDRSKKTERPRSFFGPFFGRKYHYFLHFTKYFGNLRKFLINVNINTIVSIIVNTIVNTIVALKNFFRFFFKIWKKLSHKNAIKLESSEQVWFLKVIKKTEKKPEDRCKKDRPARRPKGSGPRPPEDRKL